MTDPSVTQTPDPDPFAEVAASLYRVADDMVTLTGSGLPKPSAYLTIQLGDDSDDDLTVRSVDAVTSALLGHPGQVQRMSGGTYHYNNGDSDEPVGAVNVRVLYSISAAYAEKPRDVHLLAKKEAELARLRAEVAELRAAVPAGALDGDKGLAYSREPDTAEAGPLPAGVDGHAEGSRVAGLAPEPIAKHYDATGWEGRAVGEASCACGLTFADPTHLDRHIKTAS